MASQITGRSNFDISIINLHIQKRLINKRQLHRLGIALTLLKITPSKLFAHHVDAIHYLHALPYTPVRRKKSP
ncbi:MAG: hypothetical protein ACJAUP_003134 [Cellvibrionaceae bacterium]|jgi:hypothetical protein